jgi:hypothetical protein
MDAWPTDKIPGVYVLCNPEKERARFKRIVPHMIVRGIPKDTLRFISPTWSDTIDNSNIFKIYDPYLNRGGLPPFSFKSACLSKGEISLNINFYSAVRHAIDNNKDDQIMVVFESDSYLRRDFVPRINKILEDLSGTEWDYVSLGEGVGTRPPQAPKSYYGPTKLYKPPYQWVFRCCDSMLLSRRFIEKLQKTFIPFKECLDWELNFQMMLHQGVALWADPPLAEAGSAYLRDVSSLP